MSVFVCEICGHFKDGDYTDCYEWGKGLACIDCHMEHTSENWEEWQLSYNAPFEYWKAFKDGKCFTANTLIDVWGKVIEYEERQ